MADRKAIRPIKNPTIPKKKPETNHIERLKMPLDPYKTSFRPSPRNEASPKRDTDVAPSVWPIISRAAYQSMLQNAPEETEERIRFLSLAKIKLGHAKLAIDTALRKNNPQVKTNVNANREVYNKLRSISRDIDRLLLEFPLEVR